MSEARFEDVMRELRHAAPPAPEALRLKVEALREPRPGHTLRLRPGLVGAAAIAVAIGLGAAAIGGLSGSHEQSKKPFAAELRRIAPAPGVQGRATRPYFGDGAGGSTTFAPTLKSARRLQRQDISMRLGVKDLSSSTQVAVRQTRRLGGYVAAADYSVGGAAGHSRLDLRIPVQNVQKAIAAFTDLGTILAQHISVTDLQASVDRIDRRLAAEQKVIAELSVKNPRTQAEQARLDTAKRIVARLTRGRQTLVREGTYAKIALQLTTHKPAAQPTEPGRFDRFWGDAGDILGKELIAVLYALVLAGPFLLLAALVFFGERSRRRRADRRLLEETA
jgi:hypothetical protein